MKKHFIILWLSFAVLLFFRVCTSAEGWFILSPITCGLSVFLLVKNKKPSRQYVRLSVIFAVLSTAAYLGYQRNPFILIYGLRAGILTLLSSLAVFSAMEKQGGFELLKRPAAVSIIIAAAAGAVLSVVNTLISGDKVSFDFSLWKILLSLNPAIYEEMACRAIFMAFCCYAADSQKMDAFEVFTMYFMMCVPHTVIHGYGLTETVILCLLFGLPFTVLQRKRDLAGAMISHGIVDAVRFTLTGF